MRCWKTKKTLFRLTNGNSSSSGNSNGQPSEAMRMEANGNRSPRRDDSANQNERGSVENSVMITSDVSTAVFSYDLL